MNKLKYFAALLVTLCSSILVKAQEVNTAADETGMKSHGKIYVVMTVVIVIVAGLFLYLLNLDRKISKLEKMN
ncbi:MAG: CcmD family protein [Bacteroidota bacterium]|nr:CcmD family protein [Bacteroidota bacterium]